MNIIIIVFLIHILNVNSQQGNDATKSINGVSYKFTRSGQPTTLVCETRSVGRADTCTFTR